MTDSMVPNKSSLYRLGPLLMEQVGELETLLREGALVEVDHKAIDRKDIDYEAAIELARTFRNLEWNARAVRVVIDTALPDGEV